jgi:hypothetical protein
MQSNLWPAPRAVCRAFDCSSGDLRSLAARRRVRHAYADRRLPSVSTCGLGASVTSTGQHVRPALAEPALRLERCAGNHTGSQPAPRSAGTSHVWTTINRLPLVRRRIPHQEIAHRAERIPHRARAMRLSFPDGDFNISTPLARPEVSAAPRAYPFLDPSACVA